jgi:putative oxidoreductase
VNRLAIAPASIVMSALTNGLITIEERLHGALVRRGITALRLTVGAVFLGFGVLKFFPGVSPAQGLASKTIDLLTFGLIPGHVGIVAIATLECFIGICLLANRWMRLAVWLLALEAIGILAPLVLLTGRLFSGPHHAPTLEGQYVLKDIILVAAGMVIAAGTFRGGRLVRNEPEAPGAPQREPLPARKVDGGLDASHKLQIVLSANDGERSVQDVCQQHAISQSTYYEWRAATLYGAMRALDEHTDGVAEDRTVHQRAEAA